MASHHPADPSSPNASLRGPRTVAGPSSAADEVREHGMCDCSLDEIAARAGVCRTLVKRTLRVASRHGLLRVTERPRPGKRHDTNLVEITSPEWSAWLKRGPKPRKAIGVTFAPPTDT